MKPVKNNMNHGRNISYNVITVVKMYMLKSYMNLMLLFRSVTMFSEQFENAEVNTVKEFVGYALS
jgi:hypothetical protein